jgi:outer membrane protein assembly factor BamB
MSLRSRRPQPSSLQGGGVPPLPRRGGRRHRDRLFAGGSVLAALALFAFAQTSAGAAGAPAKPAVRASSSGQLLTYGYDNARNGLDTADPSFAHLTSAWNASISGGIYGEPLVDGSLVIVASEDDEVYGLNASTGSVAWKFSIGSPARTSVIDTAPTLSGGCGDIDPLGITGTPVIDPSRNEVYVAGEVQSSGTSDWEGIKHVLVGAKFTSTSATVLFDHPIDPPGAGSTYEIPAEQQRSALTLANGRVYVEFGGLSGDCGSYQGYALSMSDLGIKGTFQHFKVPTSREGAIWATDGAATNSSGELYVATGNSADGSPPFDYGDSVIGLSPSLKMDGYFAPSDWAVRNQDDLDLGSGGPIILPNSNLVFEIGKGGANNASTGFLLNGSNLGHIGHPLFSGTVCSNDGFVFGADAAEILTIKGLKHTYLYVPCPSGTVALQVNYGTHPTFSVKWRSAGGNPNGSPIIAGGLVFAIATGADGNGGPTDLYGMNLTSGQVEVTESLNGVEHFATPGAGDGMIFVATASGVQAFKP